MKRAIVLIGIVLAITLGIVAFAYLHAWQLPVLAPAGSVAYAERHVTLMALVMPTIVVVPVIVLLFAFAWKYRASGTAAREMHKPDWDHDDWFAEATWWIVPAAIIFVLGWVAWTSAHDLDPYKPLYGTRPPMTVQVVALDWKWLFIYPEQGIATVNEVEFPAGTPVHFVLTADAPMNSFWIPALGGQIMVMPGMVTQLNLMANDAGAFSGSSANISGKGFAGMAFAAKAVSQGDFDAWVESAKGSANVLASSTYAELARPSEYVPVTYYSMVEPHLFESVVARQGGSAMRDMAP